VEEALAASGVAGRMRIVTDGEIALDGALGGVAGILLIAGTGSVAYGRAEDGRIERCGGWGMFVGDEGSGYALGRAGLCAALRAEDGRGEETLLLPGLLAAAALRTVREIPPWVGRATKADIAALASPVLELAQEGDAVALRLVHAEARECARHAIALQRRLAPWQEVTPVVYYGGVMGRAIYASFVTEALEEAGGFQVRPPVADAVAGALRYARALLATSAGDHIISGGFAER
ncbi:MAG: hypothetical protein M3483_02760, partial [Gemmatimonadota bacterium]|nr:hypothetical protein [Gemmatimonadota bacterium]MDQ3605903.1 hypothetical protein [Gemmatimonadota bacterium]